jgi:hypothetical protein
VTPQSENLWFGDPFSQMSRGISYRGIPDHPRF